MHKRPKMNIFKKGLFNEPDQESSRTGFENYQERHAVTQRRKDHA